MSRLFKWLAASLATLLAALGVVGTVVTAAHAADPQPYNGGVDYSTNALVAPVASAYAAGTVTDNPPAPICFDPSGSDQDECTAPSPSQDYMYEVVENGASLHYGEPTSSGGRATLTILVFNNNPPIGQYSGYSKTQFVVTFNTAETAQPASNQYSLVVSDQCTADPNVGDWRPVTVMATNVADDGHRYVADIYAGTSGTTSEGGTGNIVGYADHARRLMDGNTASIELSDTNNGVWGLRSGVYETSVHIDGADVPAATLHVVVPSCDAVPPTATPSGQLEHPRLHRVRATLVNVDVPSTTTFRVVRTKPSGAKRTWTYQVAPGVTKIPGLYWTRHRWVFTILVLQPDGRYSELRRLAVP